MDAKQDVYTAGSPASGLNSDMSFISVLNIIDGGGCREFDIFTLHHTCLSMRIVLSISMVYPFLVL